jgi:hypothetical protein
LPNEVTDRRVLRNLGCLERAPRREPLSALLDSQDRNSPKVFGKIVGPGGVKKNITRHGMQRVSP